MDYSKMSDASVNEAVAKLVARDGLTVKKPDGEVFIHDYADFGEFKGFCTGWKVFDPCNNAADAWPIMAEHEINVLWNWNEEGLHGATARPLHEYEHKNALRAAMIVYLQLQEAK